MTPGQPSDSDWELLRDSLAAEEPLAQASRLAWAKLYEFSVEVAQRHGRPEDEAQEVAGEVFVRIFRCRSRLSEEDAGGSYRVKDIHAYVARTVDNAIKELRQRRTLQSSDLASTSTEDLSTEAVDYRIDVLEAIRDWLATSDARRRLIRCLQDPMRAELGVVAADAHLSEREARHELGRLLERLRSGNRLEWRRRDDAYRMRQIRQLLEGLQDEDWDDLRRS